MSLPQIPVPPGRNEEPDSAPLLPPPRKVNGPQRMDVGERYEPSGPTRGSINDLTSKLAAWGSGIRIRVKRLLPQLGPTENGLGEWIEIPAVTPTEDDIQTAVLDRYGGGEFLIQFRSQNSQRNEEDTLKLAFSGDWKPISAEGQALKARQMANGGVMPQPILSPGTGLAESAGPLLQQVLASASEDKQQARQLAAEAQSNGANTLVQLANALKPEPRQGMGMEGFAAIISALGSVMAPILASQAEARRAAEERAAEDRRRSDERMEKILLQMQTQQTPAALIEQIQSASRITEKRAELELQNFSTISKKMVENAMDLAMAGKGDDPGVIRTALARLLESAGPSLLQMGASLVPSLVGQNLGGGQQPAPAAAPAQMMMPGTPQQTVFLPRAPAPQAVGPAPLPSPVAPPPPVQPPSAPAAAPEQPQPSRADIATDLFLRHMGEFAKEKADPDLSWGFKVQGMDLAVVWGMTPVEFRQRMIKIDVEDDAMTLDPVAWVEGLNPLLGDTARLVDAALKSDPAATEWAREFLSYGPWVDEENDEQP